MATVAQCTNPWVSAAGHGIHGVDFPPACTAMWDPDGPGPLTQRLLLGGTFVAAGNVIANGFVVFDPATGGWSTLGNATYVKAIATTAAGDLVISGSFGSSGSSVARWNGTSWTLLGSAGNGGVAALAIHPNGDVFAAGTFTSIGGVACSRIARWNGTTWSPLGSGIDSDVHALTIRPNGELIAGGIFTMAGGVATSRIASWNGTSWTPLGSGVDWGAVFALTTMPNGDVVAGGNFATAGGVSALGIARWNGASWSAFGDPYEVLALAVLPNGDLVASGYFTMVGGIPCNGIARWNGTSWSALGGGVYRANELAVAQNGDLYAGGSFDQAGGVPALNIARWDGSGWFALAPWATDRWILAVAELGNGDLVAGGTFTIIDGVPANSLARWNGTTWSAFGNPSGVVTRLCIMRNGDLVVAGSFSTIGGIAAANIARWNGTAWSPLGAGVSGIATMLPMQNGDLVVGGTFASAGGVPANNVASWSGGAWVPMGGGTNGHVQALTELPNGDVVAGGAFSSAGGVGVGAGNIARWNGTTWSAVGSIATPVRALATLPNGNPVAAAGQFVLFSPTPFVVSRWTGASWQQLGAPFFNDGGLLGIAALTTLPDGDVLAGGWFGVSGQPWHGVSRWNGIAWTHDATGPRSPVVDLQRARNGDALAAGLFWTAGAQLAAQLARLTTTCPATVTSTGGGCSGSAGPNTLTATSLPWIGASFTSVAAGLANPAIGVEVLGLSASSVPLASILPQGLPGCTLLVTPDLLVTVIPSGGSSALSQPIPSAPAVVGQMVRQQLVVLELSTLGGITAVSSTNALALTIGSF
jgi:hypothetical protein